MPSTNQPPLLAIILRYNDPLERLARRIVIHKHRAPDVVKWAMEYVYEEGLFFEGPHLRPLFIEQVKTMALGFNKAVDIYQHVNDNSSNNNSRHLPLRKKPSTSR